VASSQTWAHLDHFTPAEFEHPDNLSDDLLLKLDAARRAAGRPFYIKSDSRPGDPRAHGDGDAVDFGLAPESQNIKGAERWVLLFILVQAGFKRIGLYDKHFHVDVSTRLPSRVIWIGESQ
jgi:hypothetical protein